MPDLRIRDGTGIGGTMNKQHVKLGHVVRDDDGNAVDVSKALADALAEVMPECVVVDSLAGGDELREGSRQTGEMTVLVKMVKKGKFTPRTEYEMGACQMLRVRGYAMTRDDKRFHPTSSGVERARGLNLSLRLGRS